jgi:hypothetical protein
MKKITLLTLAIIGFITFNACKKEDQNPNSINDLTTEQKFIAVLTAKNWILTKYDLETHFSDSKNRLMSFDKDTIGLMSRAHQPDPCDLGEYVANAGIWKLYQARFTEAALYSSFTYDLLEIDNDSIDKCKKIYQITSKTDTFNRNWTYNSTENTLTASFGEPFNMYDPGGKDKVFEMDYKVISFDEKKIILEGKKYKDGTLMLTNNITME